MVKRKLGCAVFLVGCVTVLTSEKLVSGLGTSSGEGHSGILGGVGALFVYGTGLTGDNVLTCSVVVVLRVVSNGRNRVYLGSLTSRTGISGNTGNRAGRLLGYFS